MYDTLLTVTARMLANQVIGVTAVCLLALLLHFLRRDAQAERKQTLLTVAMFTVLASPILSVIWSATGVGLLNVRQVPTLVPTQQSGPFPVAEVLSLLWICGSVFVGWKTIKSYLQLHGLMRTLPPANAQIAGEVRRIAKRMGLPRAPSVLISGTAQAPFSFGIWRPALVLPTRFVTTTASMDLEAVLVHEIEHIRQRHHFARVAQAFATALFWWNPWSIG